MNELVKRFIDNDLTAWEDFVLKFTRVVKATIDRFKHQIDEENRLNLYVDVFEHLRKNDFRIIKGIKGDRDSSVGCYIKKVTYNICIKELQKMGLGKNDTNKKKKNPIKVIPDEKIENYQDNSGYNPLDSFESDKKEKITQEILNEIKEMDLIYHQAIIYHYIKGYSHQKCADILNIPIRTFQTHLLRAKEKLKKNKKLKHIFDNIASNNK